MAIAKKVGLDQTLDAGKDILKDIGSEKTILMLAQQYIADHRDEVRQSYLEIFRAVAEEFKEIRFVLIFDQFENVGKASTDFFLNLVKFLMPQERFHIIVSFRTDDTTWNDPPMKVSESDSTLHALKIVGNVSKSVIANGSKFISNFSHDVSHLAVQEINQVGKVLWNVVRPFNHFLLGSFN